MSLIVDRGRIKAFGIARSRVGSKFRGEIEADLRGRPPRLSFLRIDANQRRRMLTANQLNVWKKVIEHEGAPRDIPLRLWDLPQGIYALARGNKAMVPPEFRKMEIIPIEDLPKGILVQFPK